MANRIDIVTASEDLLLPFLKLTSSYYQNEPVNEAEVVRWRHFQSDIGPSTAVELMDGDQHVGRMWIQPRSWSVSGRTIRAANPIDFLIHEDYRRLPNFMLLFRSTMKECEQQAELVYHTSNPLTDDLYRKLMKFEPVTELDGALIPIRPFAAARSAGFFNARVPGLIGDALFSTMLRGAGALARFVGVRLGDAPSIEDQDDVVAALQTEEKVLGVRSIEHRSWRFRGAGPIRYEQLWLRRRGQNLGYVVVTDRDIKGLRGRFVVDLVFPKSPSRIVRWAAWLQLAQAAAREGRYALFFFYNRANPRLARLAGFPWVTVQRERLPQRVPIFVRPTDCAESSALNGVDWSSGYFVLSDFDLF